MNDPLSDLLARIRNSQQRGKPSVRVIASKINSWILDVFVREGYIKSYSPVKTASYVRDFEIQLKYFDGKPAIKEMRRISTAGRKVYATVDSIPLVKNGLGVVVLSTSKGVMTGVQAQEKRVGGKILLSIF